MSAIGFLGATELHQTVCASVWLLGLVCSATGGDNNMKQPILNYIWVVTLDVGWNVGLGGIYPIHMQSEQQESQSCYEMTCNILCFK